MRNNAKTAGEMKSNFPNLNLIFLAYDKWFTWASVQLLSNKLLTFNLAAKLN